MTSFDNCDGRQDMSTGAHGVRHLPDCRRSGRRRRDGADRDSNAFRRIVRELAWPKLRCAQIQLHID